MTEHKFENDKNMYVEGHMRNWGAIIEAADYFLGVDSVGQHIAYAFGKPGSVIMGSTFAKNVSYPDFFNIVEKKNVKRKYSPIRIDGIDGELINRINDKCMYFSKKDLDEVVSNIMTHMKKSIGA